jgi:hypothetical protein
MEAREMSFGISEIIFILLGFALTIGVPIALVVFLVLYLNKQKKSNAGMKKCPFCAYEIPLEASVCRFCSRDLVP